ncbi:MAG: peptidylprolyl isomerase [Planctomycetota bacterium]|jgi:DNA-directed RNA polymerase subunit M/transcription elongation factor TFIIS/Arc/MetJ family transcription regulator|nr:peptidylprolyl isomerase [Planctomycetota bacterium]
MHKFLFLLLAFLCATPIHSAEFDIDSGRVILRQLQYCTNCGSALLVTSVRPGDMIRCPDCGHEQRRLNNQYTLSQLYQICKTCQSPLDPAGHKPGDIVDCANCHTRQPLSTDAFSLAAGESGPGYAPGFPPGTGKKILLLSVNKPPAPINVIPLDDALADVPEARDIALAPVIPPPEIKVVVREEVRRKQYPPIPELPSTGTTKTEAPAAAAPPPSSAQSQPQPQSRTVEVPAVTANLFGKRDGAGEMDATYIPAGKVLARVNGEAIYGRDVERVVAPVMQRLRQAASPEDAEAVASRAAALRREVLERLIDRELAVREAEAIGFTPDPAAVHEREAALAPILAGTGVDIRREAFRDVVMTAMRRRFAEKPGAASPEAVREFYRENRDRMTQPRLIALDQLAVFEDRRGRADARECRDIALEIARQLEQGRRFDEMRERYDEFPAAAGVEHVEPVLQPEAAYSRQVLASAGDLRKGAVFGPLFMPGMALFGKVTDVRPAGPIPFEEAKNEIRRRLEEEATEKNLDAWLKRLRQKARVEIAEASS